ncbi:MULTISPECIES: zinc-binding dehydrogenase [Paenibacillus]|uniref:zinc-binding dehydrogenase n=1 Tax=Paenibacillus TaxID=44249 RepID=UPI002115E319|nr:zinc-binding dehydrogenase [Paenibacillus borealis]
MIKAAIVKQAGIPPVLGQFPAPVESADKVIVNVSTAALSKLSKFRSLGMHYSSETNFPIVAGADGVGTLADGSRVYFALPAAPYGSLAEQTIVEKNMIIHLPKEIDEVTAAAITNPAMSSWAALVYRAQFQSGQTVLINGATSESGSLAIQIAKYLGAKKIIATGRNHSKLQSLGANEFVAFDMNTDNGKQAFEKALEPAFAAGVDVVLDYLWGDSAFAILSAAAKAGGSRPTRFVSIGTASGQEYINMPSSLLRASTIELVGSGGRSVSQLNMLSSAQSVLDLASKGKIHIATTTFSLEDIEIAWNAPLTPRPVIMIK